MFTPEKISYEKGWEKSQETFSTSFNQLILIDTFLRRGHNLRN